MFNWSIGADLPRCFHLLLSMPTAYLHPPDLRVITETIIKNHQIWGRYSVTSEFYAANVEVSLTFDRISSQELVWWAAETHASHSEGFLCNISCKSYKRYQVTFFKEMLVWQRTNLVQNWLYSHILLFLLVFSFSPKAKFGRKIQLILLQSHYHQHWGVSLKLYLWLWFKEQKQKCNNYCVKGKRFSCLNCNKPVQLTIISSTWWSFWTRCTCSWRSTDVEMK